MVLLQITRPLYIKMMPRRDALQFLLEHQCTTDIWTAITGAADSPLATPSKRWPSIHHTNADTRTTVAKVPGQVYGEDSEMNKTMRGYLELPPRTPSSENLED